MEAKTIIEVLGERYPGRYGEPQLRTMQRRVRDWRAVQGPPKTVYFEQKAVPGREAAFDFTHGTELGVTIAGQLFRHLFFQLVLVFSGWRWGVQSPPPARTGGQISGGVQVAGDAELAPG